MNAKYIILISLKPLSVSGIGLKRGYQPYSKDKAEGMTIKIEVQANTLDKFDPSWIRNAISEPRIGNGYSSIYTFGIIVVTFLHSAITWHRLGAPTTFFSISNSCIRTFITKIT
ncbi:hypothetical protein NIES4071_62180 [Calothrix sp. NIES-4071]|nr:hypothetical protein NIES4071_62180 [Calothrix sp. NIES-4071]BAZ60522.1 hypothetical protein NIES4105_62130 [Calothrix sp. NIES-4105]